LQFYANVACDSSGNGEGQTYSGEATISLAGNCSSGFSVRLPAGVPVGQFVTATATDLNNNTSEFSACAAVRPQPSIQISATSAGQTHGEFTLAWPTNSAGFGMWQTESLREPIQWSLVTNSPVLLGTNWTLELKGTNVQRYYRLTQ
jgi:hypothetical protein